MSIFDPFSIQVKNIHKSRNGQVNRVKFPKPNGHVFTDIEIEQAKKFFESQGYAIIHRGLLPTSQPIYFIQTFTNYPMVDVLLLNNGQITVSLFQIFTQADTSGAFTSFQQQVGNRTIQNGVIQFALTSYTNRLMQTVDRVNFPNAVVIPTSVIMSGVTLSQVTANAQTTSYQLNNSDRMIQAYDNQHVIVQDLSSAPSIREVNLPTSYLYGVSYSQLPYLQSFITHDYSIFANDLVFQITRGADAYADPLIIPGIYMTFTLVIQVNVSL